MSSVSVIIPNYNRAPLIGETLISVLSQTRPPNEVIVVDDGSTDGSADVISGFGRDVTLIRQENAGPAVARNRGLQIARGDFIQFFDSDDLCVREKLDVQIRALESSEAPFAYGPWLQAQLLDGVALYSGPPLQQRALPTSRSALSWYLRGWVIVFQCCLFRRSVIDRAGRYREDLMPTEDSELLFRVLAGGGEPVHTPEALVLYRLHGQQISWGGMGRLRRARDWAKFVSIVDGQLAELPNIAASERAIWHCRLRDAVRDAEQLGDRSVASPEVPHLVRLRWEAGKARRRIVEGVARRFGGSSFAPFYRPGPLSPSQKAQLRAIGYEPRQVAEKHDAPPLETTPA
ncbi:MAG: glycosyltransferase family A protein [Croceibacterium sp.]